MTVNMIRLDVASAWQIERHLHSQPWASMSDELKHAYGELQDALADFVCEVCGRLVDENPGEFTNFCATCQKELS
jgi:hypothetical protein